VFGRTRHAGCDEYLRERRRYVHSHVITFHMLGRCAVQAAGVPQHTGKPPHNKPESDTFYGGKTTVLGENPSEYVHPHGPALSTVVIIHVSHRASPENLSHYRR